MVSEKQNANPIVYAVAPKTGRLARSSEIDDDEIADPWTADEVFDLIRDLNDPEHPLTLEQLKVLTASCSA
jgi:hypothetical protein